MRIYVAGPLNAPSAVIYIQNLHRMISVAIKIYKKGHIPFVPCLDFLMGLLAGNWEYDSYFNLNQPWLEQCEALFYMAPSPGANRELETAKKLGLKIFLSLDEIPDNKVLEAS